MQTPPLPPPPPNEKCNLPRGSVLGRFRLPKGTYYYSETLKFTTDFMSGLRLDMSDKQNVLCLSQSTPPPSSLSVYHHHYPLKNVSLTSVYPSSFHMKISFYIFKHLLHPDQLSVSPLCSRFISM